MGKILTAILAIFLSIVGLAFGAGYAVGRKHGQTEDLDTQVKPAGFFGTETRRILSATVTDMQAKRQLVVYQYSGEARVSIEKTALNGLLKGKQELFVPASVTYLLDLSRMKDSDVRLDEGSKTVHVKLHPLYFGDVAFAPDQARQLNNGLMTLSGDVVRELEQKNYGQARQAFMREAAKKYAVDNAKRATLEAVTSYFEVPLRAVGHPDIKVVAEFM